MKNTYIQQGKTFRAIDTDAFGIHEKLPIGTYTINETPLGYEIARIEDMSAPGKLYGDVDARAARILSTFEDRPNSTGVLMSGQKGSGKTMLTRRVSELARERDMITIVISAPMCGESFNQYLQSIDQPAVVVFDEFEKVYNLEQQPLLLTIFDGVYSSKKLFMLTCNDRYRIDSHMHNRPGRLYYAFEYEGLDVAFVREYCEDNLLDKSKIDGVATVSTVFSSFSFDMLKALVEEMNRYGETATEAMRMLNMKPSMDNDRSCRYSITVLRNGKPIVGDSQTPDRLVQSPLSMTELYIELYPFDADDESAPENAVTEYVRYYVTQRDLIKVDAVKGLFVYRTSDPAVKVEIARERQERFEMSYEGFAAF